MFLINQILAISVSIIILNKCIVFFNSAKCKANFFKESFLKITMQTHYNENISTQRNTFWICKSPTTIAKTSTGFKSQNVRDKLFIPLQGFLSRDN